MVFSNYFDMESSDNVNKFPFRKNKCDNDFYQHTKIYKYYLEHPENNGLAEIIISANNMFQQNEESYLCHVYGTLNGKNITNVIDEIIDGSGSNDEIAIILNAVHQDRYDIIDILISRGFDLNQIIIRLDTYTDFVADILLYAVSRNNLPMVKYLVDKGADIFNTNCSNTSQIIPPHDLSQCNIVPQREIKSLPGTNCRTLIAACDLPDNNIMEYFLQFDIPTDTLFPIFMYACFKNNLECMKKLLDKGFDLSIIDETIHGKFIHCNEITLQFLLDNGLKIDFDKLISPACICGKIEFIEFFLQNNYKIDRDTLCLVFRKMDFSIIKIFLKYGVDFSQIPVSNEYAGLISEFESNGLDKDTLVHYLLQYMVPSNRAYWKSGFDLN